MLLGVCEVLEDGRVNGLVEGMLLGICKRL